MRRRGWLVVGFSMIMTGLVVGPVGAEHVGDTELVSKSSTGGFANGPSFESAISEDGTRLAFFSAASDIVAGDTNAAEDVFLYDATEDTSLLVSRDKAGGPTNGSSRYPSLSGDGTIVAFVSDASDLVDGDANATSDVFVYDENTDRIDLVSKATGGGSANGVSGGAAISADGTKIAYPSEASDIVTGDVNGFSDVFLYDIIADTTILVSKDELGGPADGSSYGAPSLSADGTRVVYNSRASDITEEANGDYNIFMHDTVTDSTILVNSGGGPPFASSYGGTISADGTKIVYFSAANIVAGDTNGVYDVFVYDVTTGTTALVSKSAGGGPANSYSTGGPISADGSRIAFESHASDIVSADTNGAWDVFVYDFSTDTTTLVSEGTGGGPAAGDSYIGAMSPDGSQVAFESAAPDIVAGDTNSAWDVFLWSMNRAPVASPLTATVSEASPDGTPVGTVAAVDLDLDVLSYVITAGNSSGLFAIDMATGAVTTAGVLDYETATQHVLTVTVSDGSHNVDVVVTINVTDVADPPDSIAAVTVGAEYQLWDGLSDSPTVTSFFYGNPGDVPLMGDWDCDGTATPAMYRPTNGFMYLRNSNTQGIADVEYFYGDPSDVPLAGDWDGDGCDTLAIYRPDEARIYVKDTLGTGIADYSFLFGNLGDKPFAGDFDGDGIDTMGLHRGSTGFVYFRNSNTTGIADAEFFYGDPGDVILAGDWDGDGDDTVAVYRPSTGMLYVKLANTQGNADATYSVGSAATVLTAGK